ncbi:hypothetical protein [Futiania mangrovi]|uniref:Cytochrome C oxidase assembly protein n=1 Tax=Futiania mangrovi TaxID=2959716 RepID=A0A9J6PFW4_9PROT|nr:hypothetical protein [Futiania mangrovii]MCP1337609.1 hypothetical protein [Futiania mangrovii]MDX5359760.1 hypothetical protein [Alphaproteobacteria bacterium]MDX5367826.1 hypothetical protein [Alphaproteobacteria bacterium]
MPLHREHKRRKGRNIAVALVLGALVVLFFLITVVKVGVQILDRPL